MLLEGCFMPIKDTFHSKELVSSQGEKIYVNSLNWGVTDDYQRSCISAQKDKLTSREDTSNSIKGLDPFLYSFNQDTLTLYFSSDINYQVQQKFNSIHVQYEIPTRNQYNKLVQKAEMGESIFRVPDR